MSNRTKKKNFNSNAAFYQLQQRQFLTRKCTFYVYGPKLWVKCYGCNSIICLIANLASKILVEFLPDKWNWILGKKFKNREFQMKILLWLAAVRSCVPEPLCSDNIYESVAGGSAASQLNCLLAVLCWLNKWSEFLGRKYWKTCTMWYKGWRQIAVPLLNCYADQPMLECTAYLLGLTMLIYLLLIAMCLATNVTYWSVSERTKNVVFHRF